MTETDVERVARAMFDDSAYSSIRWETATDDLKEAFRKPAKAAIAALSHPRDDGLCVLNIPH